MSAMRVGLRTTWALVLGGTLWACSSGGSDKPSSSLADLGIADGAEKGLLSRVEVDGTMDVKLPLRTGAELQIPKGAVADRLTIGIERPADDKALALIQKLERPGGVVSAPYVLTPHGTKFLRDVTVTLPVSKMGDRNLQVAYLEDEKDQDWEIIGVPTSSGKQASIELGHFSVLVLIESEGPAPEVDAASEIDAAVAPEVDAGVDAAEPPDARVEPDASVDIDGSIVDASFDAAVEAGLPTLYQRYVECGFVASGGMFVDHDPPEGPFEQCRRNCLLTAATCLDLQQNHCYHGDFSPSAELSACDTACAPFVVCAGAGYEGRRCDGNPQCPNAEDESGCDSALYFSCGGVSLNATVRCDGYPDCANSEDELGCATFACYPTGDTIPASRVCDGTMDCPDTQNPQLNDEPSTCAQIDCNIIL